MARSRASGEALDCESLASAVFRHLSGGSTEALAASSRRDVDSIGTESGNAFSDSVLSMLAELGRVETTKDAFYRNSRNSVLFTRYLALMTC